MERMHSQQGGTELGGRRVQRRAGRTFRTTSTSWKRISVDKVEETQHGTTEMVEGLEYVMRERTLRKEG